VPVEGHLFLCLVRPLISYISALKTQASLWPADLHLIAKDILRFHAIYCRHS